MIQIIQLIIMIYDITHFITFYNDHDLRCKRGHESAVLRRLGPARCRGWQERCRRLLDARVLRLFTS